MKEWMKIEIKELGKVWRMNAGINVRINGGRNEKGTNKWMKEEKGWAE